MKNRLDQDFTLGGLLRFALPTTIMMLVTSLYTIVDGVLTSRLVGENALAAINIAYPAVSIVLAAGITTSPIPPSALCWPQASCWAPAAAPWYPTGWGRETWRAPGAPSAFWR